MKKYMKKSLALLLLLAPGVALAAGDGPAFPLMDMEPDLHDQASLQRGAQIYMNYCLGCHTLKHQRFNRTAADLGIPEELMMEHLVDDPAIKFGDLIENSMTVENAKQWFGAVPPDLTLYDKLRDGPDYLYTYMQVFYEDPTRPLGVNNLLFENVGMPHALLELQGLQRKVCKEIPKLAENGGEMRDPLTGEPITEEACGNDLIERGYVPLELVEGTGSLTPEEYRQVAYDLANFVHYVGDPNRLDRERIGVYVLLFLAFFFIFTVLLGREYTKEYH